MKSSISIFDYPTADLSRAWFLWANRDNKKQDQTEDSIKKSEMIKPLMEISHCFLMIKKNLLVFCYDFIMTLSEFSKLSQNYIAEMQVKLGLLFGFLRRLFL